MSHLAKLMIASLVIYLSIVALVLNILSLNLDLPVNQILSHSFPQKGYKMKYTSNALIQSAPSPHSLEHGSSLDSNSIGSASSRTLSYYTDLIEKGKYTASLFPSYQTLELQIHLKN